METWPEDICQFLNKNYRSFIGWQCEGEYRSSPNEYDGLVTSFQQILKRYSMTGYHCTKLTENEIVEIKTQGMILQNTNTLQRRIDNLLISNLICENVALSLKSKNQSGDRNRANMLWFCFFAPRLAGEDGIGRFFKYWGGEALYNSHEDNLVTSAKLQEIGIPCVIEASVPLGSLPDIQLPYGQFIRCYLKEKGSSLENGTDFEAYIAQPLDPSNIKEVHQFPSAAFMELTGYAQWD